MPFQGRISSSNSASAPPAGWIDRFLPSWPEPPPRPCRSRRIGVCSEPHATTTARADRQLLAVVGARHDAGGAPALEDDPVHPRVGGAAEAAHALAVARGRVAPQRVVAREAERVGAARDHAAVAAEQIRARGLHLQHGLDPLEVGRHAIGGQLGQAEVGDPRGEHAIGRAVAGAGVDRRRAAHALADRDRDRHVADGDRRAAVPVELLLHLERAAREVLAIEVLALLDEHDREPGLGELAPDDGAARAGADHHHVALEREIAAELRVHAVAHVRRLGLGGGDRGLVDAAEPVVQRGIVEVRQLERGHERAQEEAAERIALAPALEEREPPCGRGARERAAAAEPRDRVEPAEQAGEPGLHGGGQGAREVLDLGHGGLARGRDEPAGGQDRLGDGDQRPVLLRREKTHGATVAGRWSDQ